MRLPSPRFSLALVAVAGALGAAGSLSVACSGGDDGAPGAGPDGAAPAPSSSVPTAPPVEPDASAVTGDAAPGDDAAPTGDASAPTFTGAIPKGRPLAFTAASTPAELLAAVVGDHPVVITAAPTLDLVGPATLTVAFDGTTITQTLKGGAGGAVVASVAVALADESCGDGTCVMWIDDTAKRPFAPAGGKEVSLDDYFAAPEDDRNGKRRITVAYFPDGHVRGYVGLGQEILFRNDLLASGTTVPALFAQLAGTYAATSEQNTCQPNPITVDVTAAGTVRVRGKSSVSCAAQDLSVTWDGQDDLVEPTATGARLLLDSKRLGGSAPPGGVVMDLASAGATTFTGLRVNFAGAAGDVTTRPGSVQKSP